MSTPPAEQAVPERTRTTTWQDPLSAVHAARGRSGLELMQALVRGEVPPPPIAETLGFTLREAVEGEVTFVLEPGEHLYNPLGSVHGGAYATLLDSACGCAVHTMLPEGVGYTSLDLSVKFLGTVRADTGTLLCRGTVTHLGRRTALAEAMLRTEDGKLLATGTSSCLILRP